MDLPHGRGPDSPLGENRPDSSGHCWASKRGSRSPRSRIAGRQSLLLLCASCRPHGGESRSRRAVQGCLGASRGPPSPPRHTSSVQLLGPPARLALPAQPCQGVAPQPRTPRRATPKLPDHMRSSPRPPPAQGSAHRLPGLRACGEHASAPALPLCFCREGSANLRGPAPGGSDLGVRAGPAAPPGAPGHLPPTARGRVPRAPRSVLPPLQAPHTLLWDLFLPHRGTQPSSSCVPPRRPPDSSLCLRGPGPASANDDALTASPAAPHPGDGLRGLEPRVPATPQGSRDRGGPEVGVADEGLPPG